MYEAERREAMLLFDMAGVLKKAAEEINTLALRCDEYAKSYDALDDDYESIKEKYDKLYEEKCYLEAKIKTGENLLKHLEEKGETENCEILKTYLEAAKRW